MPTEKVLKRLQEIRKNKPSLPEVNFSNYNLDKNNPTVDNLLANQTGQPSFPQIQSQPSSSDKGLIEYVGEALFSGAYEFGQSAGFGLPGLVEAGIEKGLDTEIGFQEYMRKGQEDNALAKVLGGVGTGAGFLVGLPVKGTAFVLGQTVVRPAAWMMGRKSLITAVGQASKIGKSGKLNKEVIKDFTKKVENQSKISIGKGKLADEVFESSFNNEINRYIAKGIRTGNLNKKQSDVLRNMATAVNSKGIPIQSLHGLALAKYGNTKMGRFTSEALHDAFIFSVADGVMESTLIGEEAFKGELNEEGLGIAGRVGKAMFTGLVMGTAVNAAAAPFKDLGKMTLSRKDFKNGISAYFSKNNYKGKDLAYLSGQMAEMARFNKKNLRETRLNYTKDGKKEYIDLNPFALGNRDLSTRAIERRLRTKLGDDAESESIKWLMSSRRKYGKDLLAHSTKEGLENYRKLLPRMLFVGGAMAGTNGMMTYIQNGEIQYEDLISSMLIGAWTQRRGAGVQSTKIDFNGEINRIRQSLETLGVKVDNTFYSSSMSANNERFGVGIVRDNPELTEYLKEQRIVSDDDETITQSELTPDEKTFFDTSSGFPIDPYDGKMNVLYQLMEEDFQYARTLDQISDTQAKEIINILDKQGFKTSDDLNKAFEDRIIESTKGMEENLKSILNQIVSKDFDDINIISNSNGIITPSTFAATDDLLKQAKNGDFESWLDGKSGQDAEEALLDMFRSLEMVVEVNKGLNNAKAHKEDKNTITSEEALKDLYNIVIDSEKAIDATTKSFDGRREFKYTDVESYLIPMMQNKGNTVTKQIINALNPKDSKLKDALESKLRDAGILQKIEGKGYQIIDDYSQINSKSDLKIQLGKIHGLLKAMGRYEVTKDPVQSEVNETQINALKNNLGKWVNDLNNPNLNFMYSMVLQDINRVKLNNAVASPSDVDFIVQQSALASFGESGLIKDKNIQGFLLRRLSIPSNRALEERYNSILARLKKDGAIGIIDDNFHITDESSVVILEQRLDDIYIGRDKSNENLVLSKLFDAMSNSKLDGAKSGMLEYIRTFGEAAQVEILSMLKQQGVIKRNVNDKFELVEENLLIEKFEDIRKTISKKGFTPEYVQNEIDKRKEISRKYISDASDVIKNPSLSIDGFFSRYKLISKNKDNDIIYDDYSGEETSIQTIRFEDEVFDNEGNITKKSISNFANRIVSKKGEFKNLNPSQKDKIIQDISQIVFGSKDKITVRKISMVNGSIEFDKNHQVMQDNPVFKYLRNIGLDFSIFDNNIIKTEVDRSGNYVEKTYNILATEDIPEKSKILEIRNQVSEQLKSKEVNAFTEYSGDTNTNMDNFGVAENETGVKKLDIYDGMESIIIPTTDMGKIVNEFNRFYEDHSGKVDASTKKALDNIKNDFDKTETDWKYDEERIELAMRYLVLEVGYKSKTNELFYDVLNSTDPAFVDKYIKRVKLFTTKNFVRPDEKYLNSLLQARTILTNKGVKDKPSELLKSRLKQKSYNVAIWNDEGTETIATIIRDLEDDGLLPSGVNYDNIIGEAHSKVSGFDSISFISKKAMMEYHTLLGHDPNSMNPIKPVISSQGENNTLLYGKTLFVYSPSIEGFFKNNPKVDILLTNSGAKAYDGDDNTTIENVGYDELNKYSITNPNDLIRELPLKGIGLRPEKDSDLLSASNSDQDYNYMDNNEHRRAFNEVVEELTANLDAMENVMLDPYKINSFMRSAMHKGNIPDDAQEGSLGNLSSMLHYLKLSEAADPNDYSVNQVQKYLAKEYIDNVFSKRRAITNRIHSDTQEVSGRYGGQAYIISSPTRYQGSKKRTRLLPTLFNNENEQILRGQIMLADKERGTDISELSKSGKNIRIVQNEKQLTVDEFVEEVSKYIGLSEESLNSIKDFKENISQSGTLGGVHNVVQSIAKETNTRYELGIISRRNPRTRPNDITLLGLKGFLPPESGLAVEINSYDIANVYEGDYDADKVDYFFAHSNYMFDYIKRNQAYFVQGIDPSDTQTDPSFTFQLDHKASRSNMLSKIGSGIAYKRGIGVVAKTSRKINYLQNLGNNNHLLDDNQRKQWSDEVRLNKATGEFDGPSILYNSGFGQDGKANEVVTIDTKMLAFYQRYALESQYILDGQNKLNKNIASNIYEWANSFLFPNYSESISARDVKSKDIKEIIKNGQTVNGKRVRIFQKYKLDEETKKYTTVTGTDINEADKLIIREFLNQQNKLLTAFGDESYVDGASRKSSFYNKYIGSKIFKEFHRDIYKSLQRQLFYKKNNNNLSKAEKNTLEELIKDGSNAFEPIQKNLTDIYNGEGGGYLDRIAVNIASREFLDTKKEYNLDLSTYSEIELWFEELMSIGNNDKTGENESFVNMEGDKLDKNGNFEKESSIYKFAERVKADTQDFNKRISAIKRLDKKKKFINNSSYHPKWKQRKVKNIEWVINKLQSEISSKFKKDISKINPNKLKYKEYISIEDSDLKRSIIHANTLHSFLRNTQKGMRYDNWYETLSEKARLDLKDIKDFNRQTYGGGTLIDDILPFNNKSIVTNENMKDYLVNHRANSLNVFELRQKFLLEKFNEHGINFLYAYMEPTRNRDAIGVFNNKPIAIPYKESKRYSHGIQILAGISNGSKELSIDATENTNNQKMAKFVLTSMISSNEHYRKFFNKDVNLKIADLQTANLDAFGLMPFDKNMQYRLKNNNNFDWTNEMLPSNPLSTINKSVISFYRDYVRLMENKETQEYEDFLIKLNDLEEKASRKNFINPIRYMDLRLRLDEDFIKLTKQDLYNQEGDDGTPQDMRNHPMFIHNEYLKFKPKQVKSSKKIISMMKSINDMQNNLTLAAKQNPMKGSDFERFKSIGEMVKC